MKIVTIIGARPQFVKAAALSRVLRKEHIEILVHTGQHYDSAMSDIFFEELDIPRPDKYLNIGSGPHGAQTGAMLTAIEEVLQSEAPDWVLVYGDTNSTLAGALAAAKLLIPIVHVEAGLRSFNRTMPEEINRVMTDHLATILLCPSVIAVQHLAAEGITRGVHLVGDVMADVLQIAVERAAHHSTILQRLDLSPKRFLLTTLHRPQNTDDRAALQSIFDALAHVDETVVIPLHPRTKKMLRVFNIDLNYPNLKLIDPVGYLDMVTLTQAARIILTDSGGLQKEAHWLNVPCITLREETEWIETVEIGCNVLVGSDTTRILQSIHNPPRCTGHEKLYGGDGQTGMRCLQVLTEASTHGH